MSRRMGSLRPLIPLPIVPTPASGCSSPHPDAHHSPYDMGRCYPRTPSPTFASRVADGAAFHHPRTVEAIIRTRGDNNPTDTCHNTRPQPGNTIPSPGGNIPPVGGLRIARRHGRSGIGIIPTDTEALRSRSGSIIKELDTRSTRRRREHRLLRLQGRHHRRHVP